MLSRLPKERAKMFQGLGYHHYSYEIEQSNKIPVIDFGSRWVKAGFADCDDPRYFINCIGYVNEKIYRDTGLGGPKKNTRIANEMALTGHGF